MKLSRTFKNRLLPVTSDEVHYYRDSYIPAHLNMGNYFIGMTMGFIYYSLKKNGKTIPKTIVRIFSFFKSTDFQLWLFQQFSRFIWHLSLFITLANFGVSYYFYENDIEKPSLLVSFLAVYFKYGGGFLLSILIFGLIYRLSSFAPENFDYPVWNILGKISFSVYIFHSFVVQLVVMDVYQPIFMGDFQMVS